MSAWLEWRKRLWQKQAVADYLIDADGAFYCLHGCKDMDEHLALKGKNADHELQRATERDQR